MKPESILHQSSDFVYLALRLLLVIVKHFELYNLEAETKIGFPQKGSYTVLATNVR